MDSAHAALGNTAGPRPWPFALAHPATAATSWPVRLQALLVVSTLLRCLFVLATGLTHTEAYYVSWARFPSWSYYDHAPMVAWLAHAMGWFSTSTSAPRLISVACSALTSALLYQLGSRLFTPRAGFLAALLVVVCPAFFAMGMMVNPEAPLAPAWLACLILIYDLGERSEAWRPLLLGALVGLAFLCKYTAVLLVPITLAYVITTPAARPWLRRPAFYAGGLVALIVALPVLLWNAARGWPTLHLHLGERMPRSSAGELAQRAVHFLAAQAVTFHPLMLPAFLLAAVGCWRLARRDSRYRLLAIASGPVWLFLAAVMIRASDAESHWTMVAYLSMAIALGAWLDRRLDRLSLSLRLYAAASLVVSGSLVVGGLLLAEVPSLAPRFPGYEAQGDPLNEMLGWPELRTAVRAWTTAVGPTGVVVSSHNVLCGHLLVELADEPPVYCASPTRTEFDFVGRRAPPATVPVLYVDSERYRLDPAGLFPDRTCRAIDEVPVQRGALEVERFRLVSCLPTAPAPEGG